MQPVTRIRLFGIRLGLIALAGYWLTIFVGTHMPKIPAAVPRMNDKVLHFTALFGLASLLCYCTNSINIKRRFGTILLVCLGYGILDEVTQSLVRGRHADPMDFLADAAGSILAISLYMVARHFWAKGRSVTATST